MKTKKILGIALAVCMTIGLTTVPAMAEDKKTFVFGDTTFNAENEEADINPQNTYAGWACIRYGVGETLFRYSDTMEIEPWIAKEYENVDELTWKITLNDGVVFSNGRACDGQAVKESLESLVEIMKEQQVTFALTVLRQMEIWLPLRPKSRNRH